MKPFPARLHVLLAQNKPLGLVIQRGPTKHVGSFLWDRQQDKFTLGQWLKGRIYERRCDLSPDGKYWIYFALNGQWGSETGGSWSAIARAPWLKVIALYGKGDGWNGGGLFTSDHTYWLNGSGCHHVMQESREVRQDRTYPVTEYYGGECPSVYYRRLQRDGWTYTNPGPWGQWRDWDIFEKPLPQGWILRKLAHAEMSTAPGRGCYWDEHELENAEQGILLAYPDWEWAEWDRNRLVWARKGGLYQGVLSAQALTQVTLIYDFNKFQFEPLCAPY